MTREQIYRSTYLAGKVKRYHTWTMLQQQTIAEHCWRVATIYVEIFGLPRAEVLYYCLHHDSGELWTGDLPFGIKTHLEIGIAMNRAEAEGLEKLKIQLPELTHEERVRCKICDLMEMWETGTHEYNLGNQYAKSIIQDTMDTAQELAQHYNCNEQMNRWVWEKLK